MDTKQNPKITVTPTTKREMDDFKLIECETYDSVIVRLIEIAKRTDGI